MRSADLVPNTTVSASRSVANMPNGHRRVRLTELCNFINGNGFSPNDWKPSGLPIIRIQNLNGSTAFNYFDGEARDEWVVEPGDLLFAWAGVKGVSFGPTIWPGPKGVLNQHIYRVVPNKGVDPYWLYATLSLITGRVEAQAHGFKSSLVHVHKEDITGQMVVLPPLPEQRKIAAVLRTWDDAIGRLDALLTAHRKLYSYLADELFFGTKRLGQRNAVRRLHRLAEVTCELSLRNNGQALKREFVMGVSNSKGIVPMREQTISTDLSRYKILPPRAFAYNPMRINVGSIAMSRLERDVLVSPDYVLFQCIDHALDPDYLDHLCSTHWWSHHINAGGSGSVRMRTYYDDLAALSLELPDFQEQQAISSVLSTAKREIDLIGTQMDALARQKRGLMQKLLSGEWRVSI
jgi:type I restriction enzyme, S subunit